MKSIRVFAAFFLAASSMPISAGTAVQAHAQDYSRMSCDQLWYERNAIYAAKGYCFKTQRARSVFGRACFPPYGRLTPAETRRVNTIQQWERYQGCR
ncbi:MAG: YARHG domain-containing protein [Rhizobium sp.]